MNKIVGFIRKTLKAYPVIVAGGLNIVIALAARYGVHVTADQLAAVVSVATAALAALTHKAVRKAAPKPAPAPVSPVAKSAS